MVHLEEFKNKIVGCIERVYSGKEFSKVLVFDRCKKEFVGDYTLVTFGFTKSFGESPEVIANKIGEDLVLNKLIHSFNVIKGFLNIQMTDEFWVKNLLYFQNTSIPDILKDNVVSKKYLIEYCSPNTNKPLHLGHIRNILLGWSMHNILEAKSYDVSTTQVINDRGIAICKSMLAWQKFGNGATPSSTGIKGDHFVGDYYVLFETKFKEEYAYWQSNTEGQTAFNNFKKESESSDEFFKRYKNDYFNKVSKLGAEAKEMLVKWESNDKDIVLLWSQMNSWVYDGFEQTHKKLNIRFESCYYESQTYLLGKEIVQQGLEKNVFYREEDGSVWVDLESKGLDKKIVLRSDGTSVYITQDLGTAQARHKELQKDHYIYVVADEQDYHFKVLFETLKLLEEPYANGLYHLAYGMVELPTGRMKSREGTVVDADDLIQEVESEAKLVAEERGEIVHLNEEEKSQVYHQIGMAALKYFMLKVQAKKRMIFDPKESVDMQGNTGPYIVNAYVRIKSIERKQTIQNITNFSETIVDQEKELIKLVMEYKTVIDDAVKEYDPAGVANYCYILAKEFHRFYHDCRILNAETEEQKNWRLAISKLVADYLKHGMFCLGIEMPDRM